MFIIAEAGTSHQGSIEAGWKLIEKAAEAGAHCIKFQVVFADEIVHPQAGKIKLPGGDTDIYNQFKKLEKDENFFFKLKQYTENCGLIFMATPFGLKSAKLLKNLEVTMIKIASPELNHFTLLEEVASYHIPIFLSGGVSKLPDIEKAVNALKKEAEEEPDITFLHCVTSYPAPPEDYNLQVLKTLADKFSFKTGVSDHSADPLLVPLLASALGAVAIEKHFTLDKRGGGLDDLIALEPIQFKQMTEEIKSLGNGENALKALKERFGKEKVEGILGNGEKVLAISEAKNYGTTNRSLLALRTIMGGEVIKEEDFAPLRSEQNISPGLRPEFASSIIGKTVKKKIENGEGITYDFF